MQKYFVSLDTFSFFRCSLDDEPFTETSTLTGPNPPEAETSADFESLLNVSKNEVAAVDDVHSTVMSIAA